AFVREQPRACRILCPASRAHEREHGREAGAPDAPALHQHRWPGGHLFGAGRGTIRGAVLTRGVCLMVVCAGLGRAIVLPRFGLIVVVLCFAGPREAAAWCTRAVLAARLCVAPRLAATAWTGTLGRRRLLAAVLCEPAGTCPRR